MTRDGAFNKFAIRVIIILVGKWENIWYYVKILLTYGKMETEI